MQKSASAELNEWSKNVVNVKNCQFLKGNFKFLSVIWVKWKQSVCSIIRPCSITFYSLFIPFFVLEMFKFNYGKFFVRHSASISKFEWFEQLCIFMATHGENTEIGFVLMFKVNIEHNGSQGAVLFYICVCNFYCLWYY